ncbi:hypothetical protein NP493_79g01007 [Ridgeia piscesae]|uniref:Paraoxonase n=1 Tax=Ridgeia piscesae TaxID=27915 RepID=A0AAD9P8W2_RIDPI|nr:hypothetical protein NP493_79g01007 [Ridgeia piscesae]
MRRLAVVVCIVGFVTLFGSKTSWTQPVETNDISNHQPGLCSQVPGFYVSYLFLSDGCELGGFSRMWFPAQQPMHYVILDDAEYSLAFSFGKHPTTLGKLLLFDFNKPKHGVRQLHILGYLDRGRFSPHGLNIWIDIKHNLIYIFVVNHNANTKETVEKFLFDAKRRRLYHVRTYDDPAFIHLADIVATGKESFYFINFFRYDLNWEVHRSLRVGNVGFYDGRRGRTVLTGLGIPTGIMTSSDGRYVYMAELGAETLNIYARKTDYALSLVQEVPLNSFVDKIDVDVATGDVWVAGHGDIEFLLDDFGPPKNTSVSPSQVFRLSMSDGGSTMIGVEDVYYNDGTEFSGSTVAVHYRRHVLIGSIDTKMLLCEVRHA